MAPNPINSITIPVGKAIRLTIELLDQNNEAIHWQADVGTFQSSNTNIAIVYRQTIEDIHLLGKKAGNCTVTITYKGVVKVLNVTVVDPIPTTINIIPHEA